MPGYGDVCLLKHGGLKQLGHEANLDKIVSGKDRFIMRTCLRRRKARDRREFCVVLLLVGTALPLLSVMLSHSLQSQVWLTGMHAFYYI